MLKYKLMIKIIHKIFLFLLLTLTVTQGYSQIIWSTYNGKSNSSSTISTTSTFISCYDNITDHSFNIDPEGGSYTGKWVITDGDFTLDNDETVNTLFKKDFTINYSSGFRWVITSTFLSKTYEQNVYKQTAYKPDIVLFSENDTLGYWTINTSDNILTSSLNNNITVLERTTKNAEVKLDKDATSKIVLKSKSNNYAEAISPIIKDITNSTFLELDIDLSNSSFGNFEIQVIDNCNTSTIIYSYQGNTSISDKKISLANFSGISIQIKFKSTNSSESFYLTSLKELKILNNVDSEMPVLEITSNVNCVNSPYTTLVASSGFQNYKWRLLDNTTNVYNDAPGDNTNQIYNASIKGKYMVIADQTYTATSFYTLYGAPTNPSITTSETDFCPEAIDLTSSNISGCSYEWVVIPETAGHFKGNTRTETLYLNTDYPNTVHVKVIAVNSCGESSWSTVKEITIKKAQELKAITGNIDVCPETNNILYGTDEISNTMYRWVTGDGLDAITNSTTHEITVNSNAIFTGSTTIKVQTKLTECNEWGTYKVLPITIIKKTTSSTISGNLSVCINKDISTYTIIDGANNATSIVYILTNPDAGEITNNGSSANIKWNPNTSLTGTGLWVSASTICNSMPSNTLNILFKTLPTAPTINTDNDILCNDGTQTNFTCNNVPDVTYRWSISDGAGTIIGSSNSVNVIWNNNYTGYATIFLWTINSCGESEKQSKIVKLVKNPTLNILTGETTVCPDQTSIEYKTNEISNLVYRWFYGNGLNTSSTSSNYNTFVNTSQSIAGNTWVKVQARVPECADWSQLVELSIKANTFITDPVISGVSDICITNDNDNDKNTFSITGANGATGFVWSLINSTGIPSQEGRSSTINWNSNISRTTETISLTATGICNSKTSTFDITFKNLPNATQWINAASGTIYNNSNTVFTCDVVTGATAYQWHIPDNAGTIISENNTSVTIEWNNSFSGNVKIGAWTVNDCGKTFFSKTFRVNYPLPTKPNIPQTQYHTVCNWWTTESEISVKSVPYAEKYEWACSDDSKISHLNSTSNIIKVKWTKNKFDTDFNIWVTPINKDGLSGEASDKLKIVISGCIYDLGFTYPKRTSKYINTQSYKKSFKLKITDINKNEIYNTDLKANSNIRYDLSKYDNGKYIVEYISKNGSKKDTVYLEKNLEVDFNLYPNPAYNKITIKGLKSNSKVKFSIYSSNAKVLKTGTISNGNEIDITSLPAAQYFIMINGKTKTFIKSE